MNTTTRQLLKIGLKTEAELHPDFDGAELVNFFDHVGDRRPALGMNPEGEGKKLYAIATQLVKDNPFSLEARLSFPLMRQEFDRHVLLMWGIKFVNWFNKDLTAAEQHLFRSLKFMPAG